MVRALKYTGKRIEQYEFVKLFHTQKVDLDLAITDLNTREQIARKTKAKALEKKKEAAQDEKDFLLEVKKDKLAQKLNEMKQKINVIIDVTSKGGKVPDLLLPSSNQWNKLIGKKNVYVQLSIDGDIVVSQLIEVKGNSGQSIFWDNIFALLNTQGGTDTELSYYNINTTAKRIRFLVLDSNEIPSKAIKQRFLDGFNYHCVLTDLINIWTNTAITSKSPASRKRSQQIANKLTKLSTEDYKSGCYEEDLHNVGSIAQRKLIVHDVLNNVIESYNKTSTKSFHFTNTRKNHLETGEIFINQPFTQVQNQTELDTIINEHFKTDTFFHICGDIKNGVVNSIKSVKGSWAIYNEDYELFNEFNKTHKINEYTVDAIKNPELNDFVLRSRHINSAPTPLCDNPNDINDANHIDIKKAYTQHKQCDYYEGFLGHITECGRFSDTIDSKMFLSNHLGIFKFKIINCNNSKLLKLGVIKGHTYILPSPEIKWFMNNGCSIKLIAGAWGSKFDIEYTDEMLLNRRYCIWAGKLGTQKEFDTFTFCGDQEWAQHLKEELGNDMVYYFKNVALGINKITNDYIVVKKPVTTSKTNHHILSFITSYTRINMLNIIMKIDDSKLIKVVLDGLYFRGEIPETSIPHHLSKDMKIHQGFKNAWYNHDDSKEYFGLYNEKLDCYNTPYNVLGLTGAGGNGKTHSVLANKNYINPLFVVPCHMLGRKARETYGCNYTTIHKLIGAESVSADGTIKKCLPIDYEPGIIFIDEATMIEASWINKAIAMYPNSRIFVAGDYTSDKWFQTRTGYVGNFGKIWKPNNYTLVDYTTDYRSKDEQLKELKKYVRKCMSEIFTDGGQEDANKISFIIKQKVKLTSFEDAVQMFQKGCDTFISGTHKMNTKLLEAGVVSGYIDKKKQIVNVDEVGAVKRGAFTIHSYQGLTIDSGKVFITFDLFEYSQLYTAISRVVNYNQLIFVV